jgi:hypothetical protein
LSAVAGKQLQDARTRLEKIQQAWSEASRQTPVEPLKVELDADRALRSLIQREVAESEVLFPEGDGSIQTASRASASARPDYSGKAEAPSRSVHTHGEARF